jgi:hypothetical protein
MVRGLVNLYRAGNGSDRGLGKRHSHHLSGALNTSPKSPFAVRVTAPTSQAFGL